MTNVANAPMTSDVTTIPQALVNTVVAMAVVFAVLIFIALVISLFKFIPMLMQKKSMEISNAAKAEREKNKKPEESVEAPAPVATQTDDSQIVAVIMAAVYAAMEEEGTPIPAEGLVIRSIKKR
ncbi:OadG family protein [Eubacterium xylanophilum]|uniref:OadG family protein n=1 Tax=Eubacterium xylanophilum TaxID=39497 RepID=UPI0004B9DFE4|nr:OadG family protein [Eubacterium xylanophilum]